MQLLTKPVKGKEITREWFLVDVKDKILGRIATSIALTLMGKNKKNFVRNLDMGNHVVVVNAKFVAVTGHKEEEKLYSNYSGYPGGLKQKPLWVVRSEKPTDIIRRAVYGMLPKNKLRDRLITRLYIYPEAHHPHQKELSNGN